MNREYVTDGSQLSRVLTRFSNSKVVSVDIETDGLDPLLCKVMTLQLADGINSFVIHVNKIGDAVFRVLKPLLTDSKVIKILHNAKFDLKFIKHHYGIDVNPIFDTFLASLLLEAGIQKGKGYHGLEQVSARYAGYMMSKEERVSDWSGDLSESQLEYAYKDAECLLDIRIKMIDKLKALRLVRCAKLEFDAVLPTAYIELCGFYLDKEAWIATADADFVEAQKYADQIFEVLAPFVEQGSLFGTSGINLNSPQQVIKYFRMAGIPLPDSTAETIIAPMKGKYPLVDLLLEYRHYMKLYDAFGKKVLKWIHPVTGRIHADFKQLAAETGRYSCSKPNLMQIPSNNIKRNCFKAEPGNTLISADFSQIELRILADLARDKNAIKAFKDGVDYHTAMAAGTFKKPISAVTKEERSFAKRLNFGIPYGAGAKRIADMCNILETEAQIILNDYFEAVPQEKAWLNKQKRLVLQRKYSRSVSGRMTLYEFDDEDFKRRAQAQRNACNMPMQATNADILKKSLKLFYDEVCALDKSIKIVNIVHDEINVEAPKDKATEVSEKLRDCMVRGGEEYVENVPVKVDVLISDKWTKA